MKIRKWGLPNDIRIRTVKIFIIYVYIKYIKNINQNESISKKES